MSMMMNAKSPSKASELLGALVGQRLCSIHKIVRSSYEERGPLLGLNDPLKFFRWAHGDVFMRFEGGHCLRVSSVPNRKTVVVSFFDGDIEAEANTPNIAGIKGIVLSAEDIRYSDDRMRALVGATLTNIGIIKINLDDPRCVNERGLAFYFENQPKIILGLHLGGSVGDMSFVEFEELHAELIPVMTQLDIFGKALQN